MSKRPTVFAPPGRGCSSGHDPVRILSGQSRGSLHVAGIAPAHAAPTGDCRRGRRDQIGCAFLDPSGCDDDFLERKPLVPPGRTSPRARAPPDGSRAAELGFASQGNRHVSSGELKLSISRPPRRSVYDRQGKACDWFKVAERYWAVQGPPADVFMGFFRVLSILQSPIRACFKAGFGLSHNDGYGAKA